MSGVATWNVLRHYANLPWDTMEEIAAIVDDPSNGMILELHSHASFDDFQWSLEPTGVSHIRVFLLNIRMASSVYDWLFCRSKISTELCRRVDLALESD